MFALHEVLENSDAEGMSQSASREQDDPRLHNRRRVRSFACQVYKVWEVNNLQNKKTSEPSRADDPMVLSFASTQYNLRIDFHKTRCDLFSWIYLSRTISRARPLGHRTLPWTMTSLRKKILQTFPDFIQMTCVSRPSQRAQFSALFPSLTRTSIWRLSWRQHYVDYEVAYSFLFSGCWNTDDLVERLTSYEVTSDPFPGWRAMALGSSRLSDTRVARWLP